MKRNVLLSADDQAVDQSPPQLPVLKPVGKLNPAPSESNQETSFIPTEEEKEAITMRDDSMPSIDTSFFSGSSDELDAENGRIDWTKPKQREEESDLMKHLFKKFQSSTPGVGGEDELISTTENNEHNGDVKVDQQKIFKFVHDGNPIRGPVANGQTLVMKPEINKRRIRSMEMRQVTFTTTTCTSTVPSCRWGLLPPTHKRLKGSILPLASPVSCPKPLNSW